MKTGDLKTQHDEINVLHQAETPVGRSREQEKLGRATVLDWGRGGWEELKVNPLIRHVVGPFYLYKAKSQSSEQSCRF